MNEKIYIAICIIAAIIPFFSSYRQLQMLQQNSYFPSRYMKWVYDSFFTPFTGLTIVFCALSIIIRFNYVIDLIIVCALLLINAADLILTHKKSIKKLVFTARIQRILICQTVIMLAALLFAINTTNIAKGVCFSILLLLSVFSPLLTLIDWAVTWPIEKMFNLYYKYDAEEKIDDCPGTISLRPWARPAPSLYLPVCLAKNTTCLQHRSATIQPWALLRPYEMTFVHITRCLSAKWVLKTSAILKKSATL